MHNIPPQAARENMLGLFLPRFLVWCCILLISVYLFTKMSVTEQEVEFNTQSSIAVSRIQEQLVINDAALSGFASLLQIATPANVSSQVQGYTQRMRDAHNQIYMFEALVGIHPKDQFGFAQRMQLEGLPDYQVYRYVSRKSKTGKPSKLFNLLNDTPVMFPVFYIDPYTDDVKSILGFDMMSAKLMREPLIQALTTGETVASRPYGLQEGGKGYILYKPIQRVLSDSGKDAVGVLVATVLVRTDPMLEAAHAAIPGASISLLYGPQRKLAAEQHLPHVDSAPVWEFDQLTREFKLDKFGQPFTILMTQQIGLYPSQLNQLIILVLLLILSFFIYLRTSVAKHRSEVQRDQALVRLAQQHDQLEDMVAKRTVELQRSSDENHRLAKQIIRIQEDQYHHLARELHDEFGQTLTAIKISAHIIAQNDDPDVVHKCAEDIFTHSDELYENIRNLIQRLRPEALDMFGLKIAIAQCAGEFKFTEQDIDVELDIDEAIDSLDETYTIATYRIIQELLNNSAKYAQANKIIVQIHEEPAGMCICVKDNGIGFEQDDLKKTYGLNGIAERVKTLGGSLDIQTALGAGVNTCVKIPVKFPPKV